MDDLLEPWHQVIQKSKEVWNVNIAICLSGRNILGLTDVNIGGVSSKSDDIPNMENR